jgi:hypothetical protein
MRIRERLSALWQKCRPVVAALFKAFYTEIYLPYCDRPGIYLLTGSGGSRYVGSATKSMRGRTPS